MVRRMEYTKLNRAGKVVKYSFIIFTLLFLVRTARYARQQHPYIWWLPP